MLTEKDYCDYETCVALKEMGYKGMSRYYYTQRDHKLHYDTYNKFYTVRTADAMGYVLAIHLYEAQKFLREEKGMLLQPTYLELSDEWICVLRDKNKRHGYSAQKQKHYEEALSEGVRASIKILQDEQKENN